MLQKDILRNDVRLQGRWNLLGDITSRRVHCLGGHDPAREVDIGNKIQPLKPHDSGCVISNHGMKKFFRRVDHKVVGFIKC